MKAINYSTVKKLVPHVVRYSNNGTYYIGRHSEAPLHLQSDLPIKPKYCIWSDERPYQAFYYFSEKKAEELLKRLKQKQNGKTNSK